MQYVLKQTETCHKNREWVKPGLKKLAEETLDAEQPRLNAQKRPSIGLKNSQCQRRFSVISHSEVTRSSTRKYRVKKRQPSSPEHDNLLRGSCKLVRVLISRFGVSTGSISIVLRATKKLEDQGLRTELTVISF